VLTGSLSRPILGSLTDRFGGRIVFSLVMLAAAGASFALRYVHSYAMLLALGLGLGLAGGSFAVGVAYVSRWFPQEEQSSGKNQHTASVVVAPQRGRRRLARARLHRPHY
jgi:MFS transporter, NNP family, nitrate/nitrite transporter